MPDAIHGAIGFTLCPHWSATLLRSDPPFPSCPFQIEDASYVLSSVRTGLHDLAGAYRVYLESQSFQLILLNSVQTAHFGNELCAFCIARW